MINTALGQDYNLFRISDHIQFVELNSFKGYKIKFNEDVYVTIIATQEATFCSTSNTHSYNLQQGKSLLTQLSTSDTLEIKSTKLDSKSLCIIYNRHYIDRLGSADQQFSQLIQDYHPRTVLESSIYPLALELLNSNAPVHLRRIQQKSKTLEIFFKQLAFILNSKQEDVMNGRGKEIMKAEKAKELIDANIANSYTIPELSRLTGTNEQYLKKHFKQLYGMTIHTYMLKNKMNHAKELLIEGDLKIAVIANKIGYKHATHFTTAFKRYFGFLPNSIRFNWIVYFSPYYLELLYVI